MFKPGDKVLCVNNAGSPLVKGGHYTIKEVIASEPMLSRGTCTVEGVSGYWSLTRFASVPNKETHMSSGGPYIASSVYNELKKQNAELKAELDHVKHNYAARYAELAYMQTKIRELEQKLASTHKPQYTPPPYIKSGWWIAMDADGAWWVFERKPIVDMQYLEWSNGGSAHELPIITGTDESMWHLPNNQWQQTLLQIP